MNITIIPLIPISIKNPKKLGFNMFEISNWQFALYITIKPIPNHLFIEIQEIILEIAII